MPARPLQALLNTCTCMTLLVQECTGRAPTPAITATSAQRLVARACPCRCSLLRTSRRCATSWTTAGASTSASLPRLRQLRGCASLMRSWARCVAWHGLACGTAPGPSSFYGKARQAGQASVCCSVCPALALRSYRAVEGCCGCSPWLPL